MSQRKRRFWLGGKRKPDQDRFFRDALDSRLWREGDESDWQAAWYTGMPKPAVFRQASAGHRINHIPGNNSLTIKSRLHQTLAATRSRMLARYGPDHDFVERLNFFPHTFDMPRDYHAFQQAACDQPERRWILKPKNSSRGRGISVVKDPALVPGGEDWMVQSYLDRPHIMRGRKYVLRLYVLVTSVDPLRVYLYEEGFAKLASLPWSLDDLDNPWVHLTNPDVNALNADADEPVVFVNMAGYREWLREQGAEPEPLFERIRDLVTLTLIASREHFLRQLRLRGADPAACYELLGLDCLVDEELKPWILECNLSPSMEVAAAPKDGGDTEEAIKRQVIQDMVNLIGLNEQDFPPRSSQPDPLTAAEEDMERETAAAGGFQRLMPNAQGEQYLPYFPMPRLADQVLAERLAASPPDSPAIPPAQATEVIDDGKLYLCDAHTQRIRQPNETASLVWLLAGEGHGPDEIAKQLAEQCEQPTPGLRQQIRHDVWHILADWCDERLLAHSAETAPAAPEAESGPLQARTLTLAGRNITVQSADRPVIHRIEASLGNWLHDGPGAGPVLTVAQTPGAYELLEDGRHIDGELSLAEVIPTLIEALLRLATDDSQLLLDGLVIRTDDGHGVLVLHDQPGGFAGLATDLALARGLSLGHGLLIDEQGQCHALGLPARLPESRAQRPHLHQSGSGEICAYDAGAAADNAGPLDIEAVLIPTESASKAQRERVLFLERAMKGELRAPGLTSREATNRLVSWLKQRQVKTLHPDQISDAVEQLLLPAKKSQDSGVTAACADRPNH